MTDKQNNLDPIAHAARLLREAAEELRQAHTYPRSEDWGRETDAKAAYDEHMAAAQALEDWEASVGAGGVQALSAVPADVEDAIAWLVTWKGGEHTYAHAHASELPAVTQARVMGGTVTPCVAALAASPTPSAEQQAATKAAPQQKAHHLTQALTDPENQPNQYGVEFGMSGQQMHFKIGNQLFRLAYEPDDQQEFEFMKRMLIHAFSTFTPDVKAAPQQEAQEPYAYAVYFPDQPKVELVHDLDELIDDLTNRQHTVTKLYTAPQPAPAPLSDDAKDAARWRWLSEHIGAAWNEGKFTSLVRIVSDKNRAALNASIDRMMTGDWSDAALAAQGGK